MRFTSNDVARLAGVSQATVSRAFRHGSSMAPETREKVMIAAQKLSYVPNSLARSLTTQRSDIVAIVIGDLENAFYAASLTRFSQELRARGKHLLLFSTATASETDAAIMEVLKYQVDGIIITAADASMKTAQLCLNRGIPVVTYNRYVRGVHVNSVCCNNVEAGALAARALIAAGARSFAVIYGEELATTNQDRLTGFWQSLDEAGIPREHAVLGCGGYTYEGGRQTAVAAFAGDRRPDALFCLNDIMALGAIDAVRYDLGLRVPDDVMVIGFDDIPEAARPPYDLTTVRQPVAQMVGEALDLLGLASPEPQAMAIRREIPVELIVRGTLRRSR